MPNSAKTSPSRRSLGIRQAASPKNPTKDPAEARLRAMHAFAEGLQQNGHRIHHTYLDLMLEAKRGGIYYACEIEAEAFRLAGDNFETADPVECYHRSLLTYLKKAGITTEPRAFLSEKELGKVMRETIIEDAEDFAEHLNSELEALGSHDRIQSIILGGDLAR